MRQKRNNQPKHITYTCEHPRDGRAYWLRIARLLDPHQPAHVDAQFQNNLLRIQTRNIQELEIDLANAPVSKDSQLSIDTTKLNITTEVTTLRLSNRDGIWSKTRPLAKTSQREYGAGAAASLFQGEPLVVVYGTSGSPREQSLLRTTATTLARCGGPHFKSASVYFPVKPDTKLTEEDISSKNLILVGTPQNHSFLKRIAKQLPVQTEDSQLHAATRSALPLRGKVLSLHYYNPVSPKRYIYIVAPYLNDTQQTVFLRNPRRYLAGSDGFKMVDQPDLIVRDFNLKIVREMQFNSKWEFIKYPGDNQRFPAEFSKREALAIAHIKAMQKSSNADFSLWWGPEDKGLFGGYDFNWLPRLSPAHYTKADYLVRHRETETMLGSIPGNELISLYDRWIAKREIIAWPAMNRATLDPKRSYRVIIPMDLVPKLGIRRRTLGNVAPGPNIMPHQILNEIFD